MRFASRFRPLAAACCLLAAGTALGQPPGASNLERVEVAGRKAELSPWFRAESQHFVVYATGREDDVALLLDNLEKLDHLLRIYTRPLRAGEPETAKLTLYLHAQPSELRRIDADAPLDALGLYSSCTAAVQGFGVQLERIPRLADGQLEKAALNDTLSLVFEAYARHFLYRHTGIRSPAWFIEGFAQYFSSVRFSESQMVVGRAPQALAAYLRFLGDGRKYSLEYDDVLLGRLADARNYGGAAGVRLEFSARAWLLTHYMLSSDDRRRRLDRYLVLAGQGYAPTTAFERAFGIKADDLGRLMWRYRLRGMEVLRVAPEALPVAQVSFRNLTQATGELLLADAALRACPDRPAGEALLKTVAAHAARHPDDAHARLSLARAQIGWGEAQEALDRLNADLRDDDASFEARYLAGLASLRLAGRSTADARQALLQAARRQLRRAHEIDPRSPEAAMAFLEVELASTGTPDEAALQGVLAAWPSAREVDAVTGAAALVHAYAGRADDAHQAFGLLAQHAADAARVAWAQQWQRRLETGVSRADILAEMRRQPATELPLKEWTLDKDGIMRKVELGHGLEAADAFIREQRQQQDRPGPSPAPPERR